MRKNSIQNGLKLALLGFFLLGGACSSIDKASEARAERLPPSIGSALTVVEMKEVGARHASLLVSSKAGDRFQVRFTDIESRRTKTYDLDSSSPKQEPRTLRVAGLKADHEYLVEVVALGPKGEIAQRGLVNSIKTSPSLD